METEQEEQLANEALSRAMADAGTDQKPILQRVWSSTMALEPGSVYYNPSALPAKANYPSAFQAQLEPQLHQLAWLPGNEETAAVIFDSILKGHPNYKRGDAKKDAYYALAGLNLLARLANYRQQSEKLKREGRNEELAKRLGAGIDAGGYSRLMHAGSWQTYNRALEMLLGTNLGLRKFCATGDAEERDARYVADAVMQLLERRNEMPQAARKFSESGIAINLKPDDISDLEAQFGMDITFNPVTGNVEYRRQRRAEHGSRIVEKPEVLSAFYKTEPRAFEANYAPWSLAGSDAVNRAFHRAQAMTLPKRIAIESEGYLPYREAPQDAMILVQTNMEWDPMNPDPNLRGNYDKAYLLAEAFVQELLPKGSKVTLYRMHSNGYAETGVKELNDAELELNRQISRAGQAEVPLSRVLHSLEDGREHLVVYVGDMNVERPDLLEIVLRDAGKKPNKLLVYHLDTQEPYSHRVADSLRTIGAQVQIVNPLDAPPVIMHNWRTRQGYDKQQILIR